MTQKARTECFSCELLSVNDVVLDAHGIIGWGPGCFALRHQATKCFVMSRICVFTPVQRCWRMVCQWWSPPMILAFGAPKVSPTTFGRWFCWELLTCDHHVIMIHSWWFITKTSLKRLHSRSGICTIHIVWWCVVILVGSYSALREVLRAMCVLFLHCEATVAWQLNARDLKTLARNSKLGKHSFASAFCNSRNTKTRWTPELVFSNWQATRLPNASMKPLFTLLCILWSSCRDTLLCRKEHMQHQCSCKDSQRLN